MFIQQYLTIIENSLFYKGYCSLFFKDDKQKKEKSEINAERTREQTLLERAYISSYVHFWLYDQEVKHIDYISSSVFIKAWIFGVDSIKKFF